MAPAVDSVSFVTSAIEAIATFGPRTRVDKPRRPWKRRALIGTAVIGTVGLLALIATNAFVLLKADGHVWTQASEADHAQVAIVPGALVNPDGTMSMMLGDRVAQAEALYEAGKVDKILVSGDHGDWKYDEPTTMRRAMIAAGIPAGVIFTDHAGFNTRATMERARSVFGIDSAIIVTQGFHMKRSLFLAETAGLDADGLTSDLHGYGGQGIKSDVREVLSRAKSVFDVVANRPVTGGDPVPITGPARASWGPEPPPGTPPAGAPAK